MTDWLARARHAFSESPGTPTDKTDETPLSSLSSVHLLGLCGKRDAVSSVSSVPPQGVSEKRVSADRPASPTTKAALAAAIDRCCALRGDEDSHRQALADECLALPEQDQRDLIEHFDDQARIWKRATTPTDKTDETPLHFLETPQTCTDKTDETPPERDRNGDARHHCTECANFSGRRCRQAERAGVGGPEVGALALVLQTCPAFAPVESDSTPAEGRR